MRLRVTADWDHDGKDDDPRNPAVAATYRAGHRAEWEAIRKLHPGMPMAVTTLTLAAKDGIILGKTQASQETR